LTTHAYSPPRPLTSFPTRRSSDLAAKRHVGFCPDGDAFYEEMSGRQFVETMASLCGYTYREARRRTGEILDLVGMTGRAERRLRDRKSTRLNSSHVAISYAVFCLQ